MTTYLVISWYSGEGNPDVNTASTDSDLVRVLALINDTSKQFRVFRCTGDGVVEIGKDKREGGAK